jgi:hypothetical protein
MTFLASEIKGDAVMTMVAPTVEEETEEEEEEGARARLNRRRSWASARARAPSICHARMLTCYLLAGPRGYSGGGGRVHVRQTARPHLPFLLL